MNLSAADVAALKAPDVLHAYCRAALGAGKQVGRLKLQQVEHSLRAIESRCRVHVARAYNEEQAARLVETWAFCAWREVMKPAGVSLPFPDWVEGILCRRANRPLLAGQIINDMEGGSHESKCC